MGADDSWITELPYIVLETQTWNKDQYKEVHDHDWVVQVKDL